MSEYYSKFKSHVNNIKNEGRYRELLSLTRLSGEFPHAINEKNGDKIIMWCINDYLGMAQNSKVINAGTDALYKMGTGSGGTRNIGGNNSKITELENNLANFHEKEKALVFTSGYVANDTVLSTLAKIFPDLVYISDEENHASIIQGIRNSRCEKKVYKHLDVNHLESILKSIDINRPKIIVFESIYSMDGLESPIKAICDLAEKYNALTYIDEVHTVGLYGADGSGIAKLREQNHRIDIIQGTLGKAIGVVGGYITAKQELIDAIRLTASGFIFTTSITPSIAASANASINHIRETESDRIKLFDRVKKLKSSLDKSGINYFKNDSHIIPIIIGDPNLTREISLKLLNEHKIFVQHINYPTVPKGTERLRFTPTPLHTDEMIENLVNSLNIVFKELDFKTPDIQAA